MNDRRRVAFIATGGTIDSVGSPRLDPAWYAEAGTPQPPLRPRQLIAGIPEAGSFATIELCDLPRRFSHESTDQHWIMLATVVTGLAPRDDIQGVVSKHGTNALEERAYQRCLAEPDCAGGRHGAGWIDSHVHSDNERGGSQRPARCRQGRRSSGVGDRT